MGHLPKVFFLMITLLLAGCSCYKLGNPALASLPFKTLYVKPVINKSFVPQAQALVSEQLIRLLQQSGIEITQCEEAADATLIVVLEKYDHTVFSTKSTDTTLASSFIVFLFGSVTLMNNETCKPYFENTKVVATFNVEANDSVQRVLYQDMPVLTQKLANLIRNLVVGTW